MNTDLIIKNVEIIDGTGAPAFHGAVAVSEGRISKVYKGSQPSDEELSLCAEVIDGEGRVLSPGFIDIHSHSDTTIVNVPEAHSRLLQGITTEFGGNCGISAAPFNPEFEADHRYYLRESFGTSPFRWTSVGEYLLHVENIHPSVNIGTFAGHGTIRIATMGFSPDQPSEDQMKTMKKYLKAALEDGAFGLSSGLIYSPGSFAQADELVELAKELVPYDAVYATHMRNEGLNLIPSVIEAISLAEESGAFVEISHHKEIRKELWQDAVFQSVQLMKEARERGVRVAFDQYPYRASATSLDSNIPGWAFEGGQEKLFENLRNPQTRSKLIEETNASHVGRWGDIFISYAYGEENRWAVGKSIEEIARIQEKDPAEACFDIILATNGRVNEVNYGMCEEDIEFIMSQDFGVIGSDGEAMSLDFEGIPHPRNFGTFPRVIAHYCRERELFSLETAIRKMTGMPAERMGLNDRGLLAEGMWADMVLFDFDAIEDTPTYDNPKQPCKGIERVYVNGILTVHDGKHTGARAGHVLRHTPLAR